MIGFLCKQISRTLRDPGRVFRFSRYGDWWRSAWEDRAAAAAEWRSSDYFGVYVREWRDDAQYCGTQKSKLSMVEKEPYFSRQVEELTPVFSALSREYRTGLSVATRHGGEVEAMRRAGLFAFGVDLAIPKGSPYGVWGDMRSLPVGDGLVDVVYCNSLDHAPDLGGVIREFRRVMADGGVCVLDVVNGWGNEPPVSPGTYESCWWNHAEDVIAAFRSGGFVVDGYNPIFFPWNGFRGFFSKGACE